MIDALSLESPMAEEQFLSRELAINWITVSDDELAQALRSRHVTLMICSDPVRYTTVLMDAPNASAVLLQISDESYTLDRVAQAELPAVRAIFRHYAPDPAGLRTRTRATAAFIGDARGSDVPMRSVKPLYESGAAVRRRMHAWQDTRVPVVSIPLGYTNAFASTRFAVDQQQVERSISISFRGNRGLAPRILGIEAAQQLPSAVIELVDKAWSGSAVSGTSADRYIEQLRHSRFALVPPGFVNAESFRYYEAIMCGALPVEIRVALTHQGTVPFRSDATIRTFSWKAAVAQAAAMSEDERRSRVATARTLMDGQFARARASILKAVEE